MDKSSLISGIHHDSFSWSGKYSILSTIVFWSSRPSFILHNDAILCKFDPNTVLQLNLLYLANNLNTDLLEFNNDCWNLMKWEHIILPLGVNSPLMVQLNTCDLDYLFLIL